MAVFILISWHYVSIVPDIGKADFGATRLDVMCNQLSDDRIKMHVLVHPSVRYIFGSEIKR